MELLYFEYEKIAIVGSEGGMSCAYFVGVILALVEKYNFTEPYLVIGSSGSTGTLAYYVAHQYSSIKNIWENLLTSKEFISYLHPQMIMNIDYLVDTIFKQQDILNTQAVRYSKTKLYVSATDIDTGETKYFYNYDNIDIF